MFNPSLKLTPTLLGEIALAAFERLFETEWKGDIFSTFESFVVKEKV